MKYEKLPTEDYDDDAQELSVELATNVDSDEEAERMLPITEPTGTGNDDSSTKATRDKKKKRSKWVKRLHLFIFLFFTTVVVFTFLPSVINKVIVWRHNKLFGGSCKDKAGKDAGDVKVTKTKDIINLHTNPSVSYGPNPYLQLSFLPTEYIPTIEDEEMKTLIIVGDVHGMMKEFNHLMTKLGKKGYLDNSHVILAGDMISKGPNSIGMLDIAMAINASCVRGNHEDELMRVYWELQKKKAGKLNDEDNHDDDDDDDGDDDDDEHNEKKEDKEDGKEDDLEERSSKKNKSKKHKNKKGKHHGKKNKHSDIRLAKALKPHHVEYIESCPLILKVASASTIGDIAVVHAGMVPGIELARQKPSVLMNIRTFVKKIPTPGRRGIHWSRLWNTYQEGLVKSGIAKGLTVVYGHDARRGLDIKKWTKGLDTNCARGGKLTALVIKGGKKGGTKLVSVNCGKFA